MGDPVDDGYRMPAEWERHQRCWMIWPRQPVTFPELEPAQKAYAAVARAVARFEPLTMLASPEDVEGAQTHCGEGIDVVALEIEDSWARDTGPTYLVDGRGGLGGVDWPFNNYGDIDDDYENDRLIARRLLERSGATLVPLGRPDLCCGFGGTFSVRQPEVSVSMADDKLAAARGAGAEALVTADPGCLMHLNGRTLRTEGLRVVHLATALRHGVGDGA